MIRAARNPQAPRVLLANSVLVPKWADWEHFHELEKKGLMMYGQMTAGSWIYIGSQGILQGTYETFAELARQHFGGSLKGTLTLTAGLGGMGGAQPLSVTMNEGVVIAVEVDEKRIDKRIETKYCDRKTASIEEALAWAEEAKLAGKPLSIALLGNAAEVHHTHLNRGVKIDIVTDQTSAHDPLIGYVPEGYSLDEADRLRQDNPELYVRLAKQSMKKHVEAMLAFQQKGSIVFDYGNNLTTATISGKSQRMKGWRMPSIFRVLSLPTSAPYSVKEKGRSVGRRFPEIRQIFTVRMRY